MDSIKDTVDLTDNNSLKPRNPVKSKFIPILFLLLLVAGVALYFLTGFKFSKKNQEVITDSTPAENENVRSPFGELAKNDSESAGDIYDLSKDKDREYYIKLYDAYKMGEMGIKYIFKSFDENTMSLKLLEKNEEGDVERNFSLSEDFLIVCTNFDIGRYALDFSKLKDIDKYSIALKSSSMTLDEKKQILSSYSEGSTFGLVFTDNNYDSNSKVKKILVSTPDVDSCYFYE